jgi:hypothetical protein
MKVECPVCHVDGVLQQRGNSSRIQHYVGFENGKRIYQYHSVKGMEVNGSKSGSKCASDMEVRKTKSALFCRKEIKVAPPKGCATYNGKKLLVLFLNLFVFHSINP